MGSSASVPVQAPSVSEKSTTSANPARRTESATSERTAHELLAALNISSTTSNMKSGATASISFDKISAWDAAMKSDPKNKLAQVVLHKTDFMAALTTRNARVQDQHVYNVSLSSENMTVANQKNSGRCWLFATTNILRLAMQRKYNLVDFELSQSYLFFYDSLSKANWFLEQILDLADSPLDDRTIQYLMQDPENDGGQWDMAVNVVEKFGLVPQSLYPESFTSSATGKLDALLTSKLREFALELRNLHDAAVRSLQQVSGKSAKEIHEIAIQSARKRKEEQMSDIYRILAITCGTPPKPTEEFVWEFYDNKKKFHKIVSTPLKFYKEFAGVDVSRAISLINDPRNVPGLYTVDRLGNVVGGRPVLYVNTSIEDLKQTAIKLLKADTPVWFGCDVGKSSSSALGLMDTELFDFENSFSTSLGLSKAERLSTGDSMMTHAMVLNGVHLDESGQPIRWRVENSWGKDACEKGFMLMTDSWFSEHVFQIVAPRNFIAKNLVEVFENGKPTILPAWDAMGSLA